MELLPSVENSDKRINQHIKSTVWGSYIFHVIKIKTGRGQKLSRVLFREASQGKPDCEMEQTHEWSVRERHLSIWRESFQRRKNENSIFLKCQTTQSIIVFPCVLENSHSESQLSLTAKPYFQKILKINEYFIFQPLRNYDWRFSYN